MQAKNVKYGIEIELNIPNEFSDRLIVGVSHNGTGQQIPGAPRGWTLKPDGSLRADPGFYTAELVSPVLQGENGLFEVVGVVNALKEIGCKVNDSCGLHVHIDARELTSPQITNLIYTYQQIEDSIYSLNGRYTGLRLNSAYCRRFTDMHNRYQGLNLTNWTMPNGSKKTVEFRMFRATLDDTDVVTAIQMCMAFVLRVANDQYIIGGAATAEDQLNWLLAAFDNDQSSKETYRIVPDAPISDLKANARRHVKQAISHRHVA